MTYLRALFLALIAVSMGFQSAYGFGKNKVIYKNFKWYYIQSQHFDIYFYQGGKEIAEFTAEVAEEAYAQMQRDFKYDIKERVVMIVYNSHNDWQQTNVVISYLEEGIGGVTELFKNRVVVPFEGSYEQFRHVIHHELVHAVTNDLLYGGSIQSLVVGEVTQAPLWFTEGIAEFQSQGWNTQIDMVVRDAVLNNYIPDLNLLQYYLVYQGGASVFRYMATTYGRKKIGEFLHKMRGKVAFERVLRSTVGVGAEEFSERWHRYLRRQYWPEVVDRKDPDEIAKQLTDHDRVPNYLNVSPAISPNGDKIAFISDRRGYQNIYLMSAMDGEIIKTLVKGQRSASFEELKWLRPGIDFSPDGKYLVFAAKAGAGDALYTVDVKDGDIKEFPLPELDGAFTANWSPDGKTIAFIGNKNNQSDIYTMDLETREVTQLTDDIFTDDQPSWSPDGKQLAFVSDRKDYLDKKDVPADFDMSKFDYAARDVYILDVPTRKMTRITDSDWEEATPNFSPDGKTLAFVSDRTGINNLYLHKLETGEEYPVTNIISGIFQINWDRSANRMVFTTFFSGGFDIYLMNNPLEMEPVTLKNTLFVDEMEGDKLPVYARLWEPEPGEAEEDSAKIASGPGGDYSSFVFSRYNMEKAAKDKEKPVELASENYQDEDGNYKIRKYKLKFSPDLVTGNAGYNTYFGFTGYTTFAFSDLLGDHKINLNVNLVSDLKNSNISLLYLYLKRRMGVGMGGYHLSYFLRDQSGIDYRRFRNYGFNFLTSYPFSKFNRLELNLNWYNVMLEFLTTNQPDQHVATILPSVAYVHDSVLWGSTGPIDGQRYALSLLASPEYSDKSREFHTWSMDFRKYFMLNRDYSLAFRVSGAASFGDDPQQFFLGGMDNWINYKTVDNEGIRVNDIGDVFFASFTTPLRGAYYYQQVGTRYALANMEFRFPLIRYLGLGFPPISFFNVRGVMFYDIGTAFRAGDNWYSNDQWRATTVNDQGNRVFKDLVSGYGLGARVFFLYFLMRIDLAWQYDLDHSSKPVWYISLGADW
ncbi:MAG TPA: DPP IV N-terminal domain-containing protein [Calditrichia bacterium]|nr:DPP IV N-terminal domain-containing protein [Calditrichia bacterium]